MEKSTEQKIMEYASMRAETIVIRSYDEEGNSYDNRRATTEAERKIIESIIHGGLLAIQCGSDKQGVMDACEYIGDIMIPKMNGYDSVYNPIREYPEMK
jgi:hypothetical protein